MTAHDAITEIRATLDAIPDTPEGLPPVETARHMVRKYMTAIGRIRRITEDVAEPVADAAQGALFDLPRAKSRSAIAEGH